MCGRFTFAISPEVIAKIFGVTVIEDHPQRYNIAPTKKVLAIRRNGAGNMAVLVRWGLIPSWAKDPSIGSRMINARCETAHEKPAFRGALSTRRCIIPASGFFEWSTTPKGKFPHYIKMRDGSPLAIAGIWDSWKSPDGEIIETCAILTTVSNRLIQPLHERMPVLLHLSEYDLWLDREVTEPEKLLSLYQPYPPDLMEMHKVSPLVNNVRNDSPDCIEPIPEM
jgi:putative SOS response-associated peptidase YedK